MKVIRLTRNKSMLNSISLDKEGSELNIKTNTFKNNEYNGQIQNKKKKKKKKEK